MVLPLRSSFFTFCLATLSCLRHVDSQTTVPLATQESSGFNSSFALSPAQIKLAGFNPSEVSSINNVIRFDQSQNAGGASTEDVFYNLPEFTNTTDLEPGTVLKVEDATAIANYSLPPNLSLSRILYTSLTLNNTIVPTSAYILWPFSPRQFSSKDSSGAPVVVWTHPTAGVYATAAPSKHRTLFSGQIAPFTLALAGYAVVAPDYAALGVSKSFSGKPISHQYLASTASANDALYSLEAARTAFPSRLADNYVVFGHSQGGGVAWAAAELAARNSHLARGYLGSIAASPTTEVFAGTPSFIAPWVGLGVGSVFPSFRLENWLTDFGLRRTTAYKEIGGSLATALAWFTSEQAIAREGFDETWEAKAYARLANAGGKKVKGPLLVIQGTEDVFVNYTVTSKTVKETCKQFPDNEIQYLVSSGTGHVPSLYSTQARWLDWINERFEGKRVGKHECGEVTTLKSLLPIERYQATGNSVALWAGAPEYSYLVPLAL